MRRILAFPLQAWLYARFINRDDEKNITMIDTLPLFGENVFPPISRDELTTVQVNLGYLCNQQCLHCHVNAGPNRKELMSRQTMDQVLAFAKQQGATTLDLTGGAPELNPQFVYLVKAAREQGLHVIDRCNLTVLFEEGQDGLADFLAEQQVEIVASMPCYLQENVDDQRGKGVFQSSIAALKILNGLGYGVEGSGLSLNFVYNPAGAVLPPAQVELRSAYQEEMWQRHEILFNKLYTLVNMPIKRFGSMLASKGELESYMALLKASYSEGNLSAVMCRSLVSVDWQGFLYDCDFNQMLQLPLLDENKQPAQLSSVMDMDFVGQPIVVRNHCFGCTAGQGSSCGGALASA